MFGLKNKFSLYCLGLLLSIPIWISAVKADDMEIYNMADATVTGEVNIIFMIDRSGSMKFCIDQGSPPSNSSPRYTDTYHYDMFCRDSSKTRMAALRKAIAGVLEELEDTAKVAVFVFGRKDDVSGGTMLVPLRALSETLPDGVTTHRQYLKNWFEDSDQTGDNRYLVTNTPSNLDYNFGPMEDGYKYTNPPTDCVDNDSRPICLRDWNNEETNLNPNGGTPLEAAYSEVGAYLLGKSPSKWGNTYFGRTGNLAKMSTITNYSWTSTGSCTSPNTTNQGFLACTSATVGNTRCMQRGLVTGVTDTTLRKYRCDAGNSYWSKLDSTLNVTSTSPLEHISGTSYRYRQPDFTDTGTCAPPSWHIIMLTDGEPSGDNRDMFATIMGNQTTCSSSTEWSCSKELALFLSNNALEEHDYSWSCVGNCGAYTDGSGNSVTPSVTPANTLCDSPNENGATPTTRVGNNKAYNWICGATTTTNHSWVTTGTTDCGTGTTPPTCNASRVNSTHCASVRISNNWRDRTQTCTASTTTSYGWSCTGSNCTDGNLTPPASNLCDASNEVGRPPATTYGNPTNIDVTWQCNVVTTSTPYDNGLGLDIKTNTIFVGPDASTDAINNMTEISKNGKGQFFRSNSVEELKEHLVRSVDNAVRQPNTISAPGVAVNQLSRFQHLDQLYYSVFKPAAENVWEGNLKRFVLESNTVKDSQKDDAVDSATKFFKGTASSCWGTTASSTKQDAGCMGYTLNDGNETDKGGMRSKLNASTRNILTSTNETSVVTLESLRLADGASSSTVTTAAGYLGYSDACASSTAPYCNGNVSALGSSDANKAVSFNQKIDWAKGVRASGKIAMLAGDPLHSQPVLVNYGFTGDSGSGTTRQTALNNALADGALQENYAFFSTNAGVLYGVDANTGEEKFAYIPKDMLPLIPKTEVPVTAWTGAASRTYGLDSTWAPWRRDANNDGDIKDTGDWAYLYGGMRMGGSNYYAMDVTNITSPTIKWTIKGSLAGGFNTMSDSDGRTVYRPINIASIPSGAYRWLGQTWSKPVLARIALNNGTTEEGRTVLVFGGGYDPTNETQPYKSGTTTVVTPASTFGTDAYGHQLYIVDAKTGNLLFWAAPNGTSPYGTGTTTSVTEAPTLNVADMKYSITGSPTPVDRDGDGYTDLIYFADLGGQVFRMDLRNKGTNDGTATTCASTITSTCGNMVIRVAKIASLGEAASASSIADQRRFFEAPGIGILQRPGGAQYMGVAIGSGNRSHPAYVGTQDRVYVFEDTTALTTNLGGSVTVPSLTHTNLEDVTSYGYNASSLATFTGKKGFYFNVTTTSGTGADGEKIFSTPLIFQGLVYTTSYIPETGSSTASNQCSPGTGSSSLYIFNVFDGRAATTDAENLLDRSVEGITSTITGDVQIVFNSDGTSTILAGTYARDAGSSNKGLRRTRWYENPHY